MTTTTKLSQILFQVSNFMAFPYEKTFHPTEFVAFATDHPVLPFVIVTMYMAICYFGSKIMKERKALDLRIPLAIWNAFLCTFSFIGMFRTVPYLLGAILSKSFEKTCCDRAPETWGQGPVGLWVMLFIFSKVPELMDTVFIVLRKKPLIFLHWYHHVTVLLFCWNAYATMASTGLYFVAMNYTVHALMYGYYCLQALNMLPASFPAVLITISQIAQMFVGTFVCFSAWYYKLFSSGGCNIERSNLIAGALMYGSYLYLFMEFAVKRYWLGGDKSKKVKKTKEI